MSELKFSRRTETALVLLDEDGNEFKLPVDDALLSEVRHVIQHQRGIVKVNPATIQNLLRQGKTVKEVTEITGYDLENIERFAPPVLAELEYVLEQAMQVPVRTSNKSSANGEIFGTVIEERLAALGATQISWRAFKDPEKGSQISLEYTLYGTQNQALWAFNMVKSQLAPENDEALELSKQQVSDVLIPKPRAILHPAANIKDNEPHESDGEGQHSAQVTEFPDFGAGSAPNPQPLDWPLPLAESDETEPGETANLLEQLRIRRSEREKERQTVDMQHINNVLTPPIWDATATEQAAAPVTDLQDDGSNTDANNSDADYERLSDATKALQTDINNETAPQKTAQQEPEPEAANAKKRGRQAMPTWDEILFGTRSDQDPA